MSDYVRKLYKKVLKEELKKLDNLSTGDEIHFTDGTIWSCTTLGYTGTDDIVIFVPLSFQQIRDGDYTNDYFWPSNMKSLLYDAIKGGASVKQGVGLEENVS